MAVFFLAGMDVSRNPDTCLTPLGIEGIVPLHRLV